MKTIRSIAARSSHRLPQRLKLASTRLGSMILLFQRMPVVQFLFPEASFLGSSTVANSVSVAVTTVVGLGAYDSVAGATTIDEVQPLAVIGATSSRTTTANAINVPATVSAPLNFEFGCFNAPSDPESWKIVTSGGATASLPAGLNMTYTTSTPSDGNGGFLQNNFITGTPSQAGTHQVYVRVYRYTNYSGENVTQLFNICALGFSTQPAASTTINSGQTTTLSCVATGVPVATTKHNVSPTLTYEWYQGTSGTLGAILGTSSSFTTPALTSSTNYWVRIKSVLGSSTVYANSITAVVNVTTPPNVSLAVSPSSVTEDGTGNLVYTFTRTGATTSALTANFSVGGAAAFGTDYTQSGAAGFTATTGTVTIPIGSSTATVTLDPNADSTVEPDETAILTVTAGSGYTVGAPAAATGTIANDDTEFSSWASVLPSGQNGPMDTPQGDGVPNLEKFAFNMDPLAPDVRHLTVGANGTAGLPGGVVTGGVLRLEFLRRKSGTNPGITYTAQFGSDLAGWTDIPEGTPAGTSIDTTWERVIVDDPTGGTKRFGRVKVVQTP